MGSSSASCAALQSRKFPAHAGHAGADQALVAEKPEGEADQDRRQGRQPRALCHVPDVRGRRSETSVRRHPSDHRRTTAAAGHVNSVISSICRAFHEKPWETRVLMKENSACFGMLKRASASQPAPKHIYKPQSRLNDILSLSKSRDGRSLSNDRAVIWRMSVTLPGEQT